MPSAFTPFIIAFEKGFMFEDSNNLNIMDNHSETININVLFSPKKINN